MLSSSSSILAGVILLGCASTTLALTGAPDVNSYIYHVVNGTDVNKYLSNLQRNLTAANTKAKISTNLIYSNITMGAAFIGGHLFLTPAQFAIEAKDPRVSDMTSETIGSLAGLDWAPCTAAKVECSAKVPWGLASLTLGPNQTISATNPTGRSYNPPPGFTGAKTTIYLIDSGVVPNASEYGNRLTIGPNFYPDTPNEDQSGHGTAMASLIGSKTFGVVKQVNIISVKAFNAYSQTYSPILLSALQWVWNDIDTKSNHYGSVINLSAYIVQLDSTLDAAVEAFYGDFVGRPGGYRNIILRAAGNVAGSSACEFSPVSAQIVVGILGHDETGALVTYNSDRGACTGVTAPGIHTVGWGPDYTKYIGYGSSMSTAMMSGYMAGIMSYNLTHDRTYVDFSMTPYLTTYAFGKRDDRYTDLVRLYIPPTDAYITDFLNQPALPNTIFDGLCDNPKDTLMSCGFCNKTDFCNWWPE